MTKRKLPLSTTFSIVMTKKHIESNKDESSEEESCANSKEGRARTLAREKTATEQMTAARATEKSPGNVD